MASGAASPPDIPPEALEAIQAPRAPDSPRRCFICLTDEDPSDPPSSWVDPCPCTLEAHQDCILSWVTDCERSGKPLRCPICKAPIHMDGPWDPIVSLADGVQRRFTRVSPFMLFTSLSLGVQFSSQMYGALALWMFAGRDALVHFMLGPDLVVDGRPTRGLKLSRVGNAAVLMHVAPALLIGQLLPSLGNRIFVPTASLYGIYHVMRDEHFVSWPPSPQLALAIFPYIRSIYYNMWREFVQPYEIKLNRQMLGLPPLEPPRQDGDRRNARAERNAEGGVVGFLQSILDALDNDDDDGAGGQAPNLQLVRQDAHVNPGDNDGDVMVDVELLIEEEAEQEAAEDGAAQPDAQVPPADPLNAEQPPQAGQGQEGQEGQQDHGHEAPPPPPANRPGLGTILSNVSNALVSALILPGVSFAMGEALRLALPSSWVSEPRYASRLRPGFLQKQWGRSLVGGCLYVVIKDLVRLYAKHRKVANMGNRRVRNVDRPRRHVGNGNGQ